MKAFGVFEGGDVRGYAHVGALRVAEERGIRFVGLAGTSAGAIVASLAAAGLTAHEIYSTKPETPGVLNIDPLKILEPGNIASIDVLVELLKNGQAKLPLSWWLRRLPVLPRFVRTLWREFGLADLSQLELALDNAMRRKLRLDRTVCFSDLRVPLRVVASDIGNRRSVVFGSQETPGLGVASAVTASATYPLVFRPSMVEGRPMLDGGIVSNTPAWVFDAERANVGPQTPTVIFRLVDEAIGNDQAYERWSFPTFVASFVRTAAFGAGHLETRAIESAYAIALRSSVAPTDFLAAGNAARRVVEDGEQSVRRFFLTRIGPREPERMRALLRHVAFYVRDQASATLTRRPDRVRCGVIVPSSVDPERVQVRYSAFMEDAADDHLVMSRRSLGVASVFLRKEPVITRPDLLRAEAQAGREDKYEHLLRPLDIRTTYTVPIFAKAEAWMCAPEDRAELIGALYIDADSDLAPMLGLVEAEDRFATLAQIVGEELQDRVVISGSEDTVGGRGPTDWEAIAMGTVWVSTRKLRTMVSDVGLRALLERIARDLKPSGLSGAPQRFS